MAKTNSPESSEKLQIAILTFFMTAGGFLLLTLVFAFFLNDSKQSDMKLAERRYSDLTKLLAQEDMRRLRQQDKISGEKDDTETVREIIDKNLSSYGIEYRDFPPSRKRARSQEITQKITLKPTAMRPILQFVAAVEATKKSIRVASLDFNHDKRAGATADSWNASIDFIEYDTAGSQ